MRCMLVAIILVSSPALAQPTGGAVALLPLDADQRLEIYGQPVASEIARALVAGGIDVVVVGPKMAVPDRARLVVDGTIKAGKNDVVTVSVRIRDRRDGTVLETLESTAGALTSIDRAAEDLSARVLPSVRARLAALDPPKSVAGKQAQPASSAPAAPPTPPLRLAIVPAPGNPLQAALAPEALAWARAHHREPHAVEPATLFGKPAPKTAADGELGIALDVLAFVVDPGPVPVARARIRVRVVEGATVAFDRVIVTDTIVGDRGLSVEALAIRTAREVLAIAEPHVRRAIATWR